MATINKAMWFQSLGYAIYSKQKEPIPEWFGCQNDNSTNAIVMCESNSGITPVQVYIRFQNNNITSIKVKDVQMSKKTVESQKCNDVPNARVTELQALE